MEGKFLTKEEIRVVAQGAIGKTFGELTNKDFNYNNKGTLGQLLETSVFNFANNSSSAPDFESAGIELKLTPYKKNKNGTLSAKERLVLNIIDYLNEYKYNFFNSHFMYKNRNIQLLWYLYEPDVDKKNYRITNELFLSLDEEEFKADLEIIKRDWELIIDKIKKGEAHNLSESDTMYLGACPKGKDKTSLRKQPFNDILAMQRAFCYKSSYMTFLVRKYISNEITEKVLIEPLKEKTFEEFIIDKVKSYYGKSETELEKILNVDTRAKNKYQLLFSKMLKINDDIEKSEEFQKANIKIKTIRVEKNGNIKESMSFPAFKYEDIVKEQWEESSLYNTFESTKFLFVIFKNDGNQYIFDKVKIWNMPESILNADVKSVWEKTKKIIKNGNVVKEIKNDKYYTNFPKMTDNDICHVRPHAKDFDDTYDLPVKDKVTGRVNFMKQCFWLNSSYIEKIIGE